MSSLSGAETFSEEIPGKPIGVAIGAGSAWVLSADGKVLRYDLAAPARVATVSDVAKHPSHIAFAAGAVWVAEDNDGSTCDSVDAGPAKVIRIDPANNTVVAKISVSATTTFACNRIDSLVSDGKTVFALIDNSFGAARVDPATNTIGKRAALGEGAGYGAGHAAVSEDTLWVLNNSSGGHFLHALDSTTLAPKSKTATRDKLLGAVMVASKDAVYVDGTEGSMVRVDAAMPSNQEEKTFPLPPDCLALHKGTLFGSSVPVLAAVMVGADPVTLMEKSRIESPYLFNFDRFAFVE